MDDYRRHDAPSQERKKEVLSPYVWAIYVIFLFLVILGMIMAGLGGAIVALGGIGITCTSAPSWTRNSFLEKKESEWIARTLEKNYQREKIKAAREASLKFEFENPGKAEKLSIEMGCLSMGAIICTLIGLQIAGVQINNPAWTSILGAFGVSFYPAMRRFGKAQDLQLMADEPRGGIQTVTLRDLSLKMERWPNRYLLFGLSSITALIATILLA